MASINQPPLPNARDVEPEGTLDNVQGHSEEIDECFEINPSPALSLLTLPYEIREMIYRYALPHYRTGKERFEPRKARNEIWYKQLGALGQRFEFRIREISAPLFPCKQIYEEVKGRTKARVLEGIGRENEGEHLKITDLEKGGDWQYSPYSRRTYLMGCLCILWQNQDIKSIKIPSSPAPMVRRLGRHTGFGRIVRNVTHYSTFREEHYDGTFLAWLRQCPMNFTLEWEHGENKAWFMLRRTYRDAGQVIPNSDGLDPKGHAVLQRFLHVDTFGPAEFFWESPFWYPVRR